MLVGISQRNDQNQHGTKYDNLENSYIQYLEKLGMTVVPLPNSTSKIETYFDKISFDGIVLSGGNDINPRLYGKDIAWSDISRKRDAMEKKILEIAIRKKIPILGICRGMQMINVLFGGKLIRNINKKSNIHAPGTDHEINITFEEAKLLCGEKTIVNSFHNQAITTETLSPQLLIFALSQKDGFIEGLYHPTLPIAGIQWHPERRSPDKNINEKLIKAFANRELFWKLK